jgi:hypothetical protein
MNIIEAAKLLKKGELLMRELGFVATIGWDGMLVNVESGEEPFGFFIEELLSEKWTVVQ